MITSRPKLITNIGFYVIFLYLVVTYIPQMICVYINMEAYSELYSFDEINELSIVIWFIFTILLYFGQKNMLYLIPDIRIKEVQVRFDRILLSNNNIIVFIISIFLGLYYFFEYGFSYRHTGPSLLESKFAIIYHFLKLYISSWIYKKYSIIFFSCSRSIYDKYCGFFISIYLILTINGSIDAILILWVLLYLILPVNYLRSLFVGDVKKEDLFKTYLLFGSLMFLLPIVMIAIGYLNKGSFDYYAREFSYQSMGEIIYPVVLRVSSSYASLNVLSNLDVFDYDFYISVYENLYSTFLYRSCALLNNSDCVRPDITQISRLNYFLSYRDISMERAGASPGLLASALYAAPCYLGIILLLIYSLVIIKIINNNFYYIKRYHLLLVIYLFTIFYPLLESPIDYLGIFDPTLIYFLILPYITSPVEV